MTDHSWEIAARTRFEFGANWAQFLSVLNEDRIALAEESLREMLRLNDLSGKTFLDIGSGSGLFSLAARRLGAKVHSFDFDPQSVECTNALRDKYFTDDSNWKVEAASVLDFDYLQSLGRFDIVYSWGVLHHTGSMWNALHNVSALVASSGKLFIAIYNDQGRASRIWLYIKTIYNYLPKYLRWMVLVPSLCRLWGPTFISDAFKLRPFETWRSYADKGLRGMSPMHDVIDWVGGLPFEVAKPDEIFEFYRERGFELDQLRTCAGGIGCNEFVFRKK